MKNIFLTLTTAAALAAFASTTSAQTTYIGTGGNSTLLDIDLVGNWDNGLPTSPSNVGTISTNSTVDAGAGNFTYTNYYLNLTGGTMTQFNSGNNPLFSGGNFTVNGGTYGTSGGRGFSNGGGNNATLTSGTINAGSLANSEIGANLTINGGLFRQHGATRGIRLSGGANLTVNAGTLQMETVSATGTFGVNQLSSGSNTINLNGGTTSVNFLAFGNNAAAPRLRLTLGGNDAGSLTAVNFQTLSSNEVIGARRIDWLTGTQMTMTITSATDWAETEWTAGRMFFNGSNSTALGGLSWADASNASIGLGNNSYFDYNSSTNTLSLGVIPEPSTMVLLAFVLTTMVIFIRRRRQV